MEKQPQKILIIKMRFHGDMLVTTPVISTLKHQYPNARIDVLLYKDTVPILSENPEISTLYGIVNKNSGLLSKLRNFFCLTRQLRGNQYDLIINLTDQWIISVLVRFITAKRKISQNFQHRQAGFWKKSFTDLVDLHGDNVVTHTLSVLEPLNIHKLITKTRLFYKAEQWENIRQQLHILGVNRQYVVIQPTARQLFKCWDNEKFAQVIDALQHRGYFVILTSGPSEEDLNCIMDIAKRCKMKPITELAGKTHFLELGALIKHASLFIGVDSAPGHIAAAVNTPIISLFGATNHIFWRPWSDNMIQLWAGDYQPMPTRDQLDRNKSYLSAIPADDVIAAAQQLLLGDAQPIDMDLMS